MDKLNNYLLSNFSQMYFSIFLPLYVIASVIMLIKIAAFTSIIQLNLYEMVELYLFMLPDLLFYTLPITFFIAAVLTISKLSFDNEIIIIFSLGIKPSSILKFFAKLALWQTLILILLFFVLEPHTNNLSKNFLNVKKSEAKFNIQASEYGHKFGDWLIFVGEDSPDGKFNDVILFNQKSEEETMILAEQADVVNEAGVLKLQLDIGKGFNYTKDTLSEMNYRKMYINDSTGASTGEYQDTFQYWLHEYNMQKSVEEGSAMYLDYQKGINKKKKKLTTGMLISLFPLLSVFLILTIGIINARHQKSYAYAYIFITVLLYYSATFTLAKPLGFFAIALLSVTTLLSVIYLYNRKVVRRY